MNTTYIIFAVVCFACFAPFAVMLIGEVKRHNFRKKVNPGDVVNFKINGDVQFKVVKCRPSKELVILNDLDDETMEIQTSIYKIYPL